METLRAGASGLLLKCSPAEEMVQAVLRTLADRTSLLFPQVMLDLLRPRARTAAYEGPAQTRREGEVLEWIAQSMTNPEIAEHPSVGVGNFSPHVGSLLGIFGARGRRQATVIALRIGLVDPAGTPPLR